MSYKKHLGRLMGLRSAKGGTYEWWVARLTSAALIPLALIFIVTVAPLIGESQVVVTQAFQNPLTSITTILFLMIMSIHLSGGLHEVIVDYVHRKTILVCLLFMTKLLCWGMGFAGAAAVAKMALSV